MSAEFEGLWRELRETLKTRGDLPLRSDVLTPAEIAEYVRGASGDERTRQFVWDYYYPRYYGNEDGAMSDDEAAELVASMRKQPPAGEPPHTTTSSSGADRHLCGVCHRRDVQGLEPGARS